MEQRQEEIKQLHIDYADFYRIGAGLALVLFGVWIGSQIFAGDDGSYATNIYTEILSIGVTVLVLNFLAERREEKRETRQLKARLVVEAGGQSNEAAKRAIDELRANDWLESENSLIKGAVLAFANLARAGLMGVHLEGAKLVGAFLNCANLFGATLTGVTYDKAIMPDVAIWTPTLI